MPDVNTNVVTRFAPSPTGYLHIGGARTALFAWAFARHHVGANTFILRFEDTDQSRSSAASTVAMIDDLKWLGIDWDEGPDPDGADPYQCQRGPHAPYFQSQRLEQYRDCARKLIAAGRAFDDNGAVRFRMPGRDITVHDEVLGDVTIARDQLEDFIILKSDGFPTFHLAVVVDDATMGTTHVLRGQEHLMNTPKHVALQEALGYPTPRYAHMPAILNPDNSKMGKRDKAKAARKAAEEWLRKTPTQSVASLARQSGVDGSRMAAFMAKENDDMDIAESLGRTLRLQLPEVSVIDFRRSGYLPEVILNYLALLGWSPPDKDHERFSLDYLVSHFTLDRVGRSNAKFDRLKLLAFNQETISKLSPDEFFSRWLGHLRAFQPEFVGKLSDDALRMIAEAYRPRSKTLADPAMMGRFFITDDDAIEFDAKAVEKVLRKNDSAGLKTLAELRSEMNHLSDWSPAALHAFIEAFSARTNRGMGDVAQPLRVAITGTTVSPAIHDTLAILGKTATINRINRCLTYCGAAVPL